MIKQNSYSVILPTLNEVGHIKSLILDISKIFYNSETQYEIIIVDDSSTDGTIESLQEMNQKNLIIHSRINKKQSLVSSLNEGISIANYENIIWMDADYSHPPEYILDFINTNKKDNLDVVVCSRFLQESKRYYENTDLRPVTIDLLSIVLNKVCRFLLFKDFTDYTSGFICVKSKIIKNIILKGYYGDYFIVLIAKCKSQGKKILEIPFIEKERASGKSKTTGNKFNFFIKCFFYIVALFKSFFIKAI
jgi:dolichol-phosphate mannosyltransferase